MVDRCFIMLEAGEGGENEHFCCRSVNLKLILN